MNIGSCLALNLNYSGCCVFSLSPTCFSNGCFCDQACHILGDCCYDIGDIGCFPASPIPTPTNIPGKTKSEVHASKIVPRIINQSKDLIIYQIKYHFYVICSFSKILHSGLCIII